jgi:chaperonin GroES
MWRFSKRAAAHSAVHALRGLPGACRKKPFARGDFGRISLVRGRKITIFPSDFDCARSAFAPKTRQFAGNAMKFRPLHDRVVIRRVEEEDKTKGGIFIPDTAKEKPMEGEIVAVGPGARSETGAVVPLDVQKGDRILFGKWSGTEIKLDGEDLLIMAESDIMGVIEGSSVAKKKAA